MIVFSVQYRSGMCWRESLALQIKRDGVSLRSGQVHGFTIQYECGGMSLDGGTKTNGLTCNMDAPHVPE